MEHTITDLLKQLAIAIPSIIVATQTLTAALHGIFKMGNPNIVHLVSWLIAALTGVGFVYFNGLDFGFEMPVNLALGLIAGVLAGGAANGIYDWPAVKNFFDSITNIFSRER